MQGISTRTRTGRLREAARAFDDALDLDRLAEAEAGLALLFPHALERMAIAVGHLERERTSAGSGWNSRTLTPASDASRTTHRNSLVGAISLAARMSSVKRGAERWSGSARSKVRSRQSFILTHGMAHRVPNPSMDSGLSPGSTTPIVCDLASSCDLNA